MNEVLTRAEMEAQFDGEWVLVADPEVDDYFEVLRGQVVYHSSDREAVYNYEETLSPQKFAHVYLGSMPQHIWLSGGRFLGSGD